MSGEVTGFRLFRATGLAFAIVRRTVLLGNGVGAAFTAIAPKHVGTTSVFWLEFEAGQRGLFSLARC